MTAISLESPMATSEPVSKRLEPVVTIQSADTPGHGAGFELQPLPSSHITSALLLPFRPEIGSSDAKKERLSEYTSFAALLWSVFLNGWNDGTSGPIIPAMQRHYHIGFAVVSMIFVLNCVGFLSGAITNVYLPRKIGFGSTLVVGAIMQAIAYCIQGPAPPFPVFAMAYCISGFGIALQNAQAMVFVVSLNNNSATKMGILHATYGVGALVAPLSATKFAAMPHWSFHFLASLGGAIFNVLFLTLAFRFQRIETVLTKAGQTLREQGSSQGSHFKQIFKLRVVHLLAFFVLAYVGVEVTLGGWIVTFVIDKRGGGSSSGYITSGFFGGLTLGRIGLLWVNHKVGERRVIWIYIFLAISLEITIWLIPSLIGNAIAVSFVGLFLGPIYPIVMNRTGRLVPHWLLSGSVGWIAGLGQTGSAFLPFVTGTIASRFGVMSLQPLLVSVMSVMVGLWALVPPEVRRSD